MRVVAFAGDLGTSVGNPRDRDLARINDGLLRLSVGLEDADDLWDDLNQSLAKH